MVTREAGDPSTAPDNRTLQQTKPGSVLRSGRVSWSQFDILNGHSHRRMVRAIGRLTLVNAGTLHRAHEPGFMILDFGTGIAQWFALASSGDIAPRERWRFAARDI